MNCNVREGWFAFFENEEIKAFVQRFCLRNRDMTKVKQRSNKAKVTKLEDKATQTSHPRQNRPNLRRVANL